MGFQVLILFLICFSLFPEAIDVSEAVGEERKPQESVRL
jgi:hypothetical protein